MSEQREHPSREELLGPPKIDFIWVIMVVLTALIVWSSVGALIFVLLYFTIGRFSLETWASPILLAMITFFAISLGNVLSYALRSRIFPDIYTRSRSALSQIVTMSIVLYVMFAPLYLIVARIAPEKNTILLAFSLHVLISLFTYELIVGLISHYRYSLLSLYASITSLLISALIVMSVVFGRADASVTLFILLTLTIMAYVVSHTVTALFLALYSLFYKNTGHDPLGTVFARIENDERELEEKATKSLTQF